MSLQQRHFLSKEGRDKIYKQSNERLPEKKIESERGCQET